MKFNKSNHTLELTGDLTFPTVPKIWEKRKEWLANGIECMDLTDVTQADSAGVALLLALLKETCGGGKCIQLINIPKQVKAIAKITGVQEFLGPDSKDKK